MGTDNIESKTTGLQATIENLIGARRESNGVVIFSDYYSSCFLRWGR
jgi:hypothetical protein